MRKKSLLILGIPLLALAMTAFILMRRGSGEKEGNERALEQHLTYLQESALNVQKDRADETTLPAVTADHIVVFGRGGYRPKNLTIKAGDRVVFSNQADLEGDPLAVPHVSGHDEEYLMWPMANALAADSCSPSSFYPCTPFGHGESYPLVLSSKAVWKYHDRLHAEHQGTIVVE